MTARNRPRSGPTAPDSSGQTGGVPSTPVAGSGEGGASPADPATTLHVVRAAPPEALFGLDPPSTEAGPLEQAVRATLQTLNDEQALTPHDAARCALAMELAGVIREKRQTRRTSTIGNDARVLMDILDGLAPVASSEADQQLRKTMEEWSAFIRGVEAAGDAAPAEVRD